MSILVNENTKLLVQGITGKEGAFHTKQMLSYGTRIVAGVTPSKGGQEDDNGIPIFNTIEDAIKIVNSTNYGLNAALISNNYSNIKKFIKDVVVGGVRINAASSFRNEMLPFGGINYSGYGRGGIRYAMKEMSNLKTILI